MVLGYPLHLMDYERLARQHKDAVYRQMVRVCGNHDDAEDVLVQALLSAHKAIDQIEQPESFRGWLSIVGRRICSKMKRRESLRPIYELADLEDAGTTNPEAEMVHSLDAATCVKQALAGLPPSLKSVYELREVEGLSAEETAARLGITVPAVKAKLHRARVLIRKALDQGLAATC